MTSLKSSAPLQRTRRACDQCRRRKTKCDGNLKCKSCSDIGLVCSYGSRIRQGYGAQYIAYLAQKLKDLESHAPAPSLSSTSSSDAELADWHARTGSSDLSVLGSAHSQSTVGEHSYDLNLEDPPALASPDKRVDVVKAKSSQARHTAPANTGVMSTYRGRMSVLESLRNLRRLCGATEGAFDDSECLATSMADALDSSHGSLVLNRPRPTSSRADMWFSTEAQIRRWIDIAFADMFTLWPFIDGETFAIEVDRLFDGRKTGRSDVDPDYMALIHAVIALGQRCDHELIREEGGTGTDRAIRGIAHFETARDLVPLTQCNRSLPAVQTILCMCLYVKSMHAQRLVHTYVCMAGYAVHQLGLHQAASAYHLPERTRLMGQQVYNVVRTFDAYVTSSLGLPRNFRPREPTTNSTDALFIAPPDVLYAANANTELLEITGSAIEKFYSAHADANNEEPTFSELGRTGELGTDLLRWELKYPIFAEIGDADTAQNLNAHTKTALSLGYSRCFVHMILYCPFIQHITSPPWGARQTNAYACGSKCVEAAVQAVRIAQTLSARGELNEAYALTVDVLAIAATTLLAVELKAPKDVSAEMLRNTSRAAKTLLEDLAQYNNAAAQCLESLLPLYLNISIPAPLSGPSAHQQMQDWTHTQMGFSQAPTFNLRTYPNPQLNQTDLDSLLEGPSTDLTQSVSLPTTWNDWGYEDYAGSSVIPSLDAWQYAG